MQSLESALLARMIQFLSMARFGVLRAALSTVVAILAIAQNDGQNLVLLHANSELIGELFEDGQATFVAGDLLRRNYRERERNEMPADGCDA